MRMRRVVAAGAGATVAAVNHVLDTAGLLPFVHESEAVRQAMSPAQATAWLVVAGVLAAVAVSTRLFLVTLSAAIAISAAPELIARHDPGAIAEPAALLGAALQLLLITAVVLFAAALERRVAPLAPPVLRRPTHCAPRTLLSRPSPVVVDATAAPRAPPCRRVLVMT